MSTSGISTDSAPPRGASRSNDLPAATSAGAASTLVDPVAASDWFSKEVHPHGAELKSWLWQRFPSIRGDVEDVVQQTFFRVWKRQASHPIRSAKSFLFRAARNIAIDLLRRSRRSPVDAHRSLDELHVLDGAPDAGQALSDDEIEKLFVQAIASLPPRACQVILLHKLQGLSQKQVAAKLGLSPRTVEAHVLAANKHCEIYLRRHGITSFS